MWALAASLLLAPVCASAIVTPAPLSASPVQAQAPAACERACSLSNAGNCQAGDVTGNPRGDTQCASSRIGVAEYTLLTSFGSSGSCVDPSDNNRCASGSCTTYQGQPVFGIAHRTFPFGTRVEVCNTKNGVCQIATVVERGPNASITRVTVDARAELAQALLMGCNNSTYATYKVLSVPGVSQAAQPSGPAQAAFDKLLAAGHINGNLGNNAGNPGSYTAVNTPYGPGYLGNPTAQPYYAMQPSGSGSPYASATPVPIAGGSSATLTQQPVSYVSPYGSVTGNAATDLQSALVPPAQTYQPQQPVVSGAPSVGQLIVQPRVASRFGSVLVSWTSLNMKPGSCVLSRDSGTIVRGEEGSTLLAASSLPTGAVAFTLTCTVQNGTTFQTSDTITIQ